ncbi:MULTISPECIES: DUF6069 family protein [unclassified Streptomyces]|uniref:DUF6069 family protein n=1 Tax=unclassified Streptomyces TaxID=2593676 RepID=UPI000DC55486|nr:MULTISPECIES: DUF6069 family protein [unclassified Streptomyces]MYT71595.1 hypothetical protein [Streptomyces sp. SID8367]RAJ72845.1 hypothetical protein K377_07096 [Streptomyces sp. PsTaAH-137]
MTSSNPAATDTAPRRRALPAWQAVAGAAVLATVVNLIVLYIGDAAGASLALKLNGKSDDIGAGDVIFMSLVAPAIGITAVLLLARWKPVLLRVGQVVSGAVAALTAIGPLTLDTDGGTAATLITMHLFVGCVAVAALEVVRRSRV